LPLPLARQVDAACCRFEAAWKGAGAAAGRPRIEDYLADTPEPARPALLRELIQIEAFHRRRAGDAPRPADYQARFAELGPTWIAQAVGAAGPPPAADTPPAQATERTGPPPEAPGDGPAVPGYEILGLLGRGGMGEVYLARDPDLNRRLAVKVLQPRHRGQPELALRFREEAQVTGQLQHPGVPPVHEVGRLPDGRPFFAMKLIRGRALAELLKARPRPGDDLARFLAVFEQVCQAVAYAHSQGVVHRDLKPSNIMVGAFGEVQVLDWGLAKVLGQPVATSPDSTSPGPEGPGGVRTVRSGTAGVESAAGTVLGTLAYMAPEAARGEVEQLDERCDVFGLGAILCEVLTGQPPHLGETPEATHLQAARGDLAEALGRLDRCGAGAELVRIAKECLAPQRAGRPRDAGEVAKELSAYLEGVEARLRRAELDRAEAEVRAREERKRRRVQLAWAAVVLLLVGVSTGGAWRWQQQRQARAAEAARRQQETDGAVAVALGEAEVLRQQARSAPLGDGSKYREALAAARKARELAWAGEASQGVRQQATDLSAELEQEAAAAERDRVLLVALLEVPSPREGRRYRADEKGLLTELAEPSAEEQFGAAFRAWGLDVDGTSTAEAVARLKARPAAVVREVIAGLDEWASERRRQRRPGAEWRRLAELAKALEEGLGTRRGELRAILERGQLPVERALGVLAAALRPVPVPFDAGPGADRGRLRELAEKVLAKKTGAATEPVLGLLTLARALREAGDDAVAERLLRAAVQARPREVVLYDALGKLLREQRPPRWAEAVECYVAARALRPELGTSLAEGLVGSGRAREGLALYERLTVEKPDNPWAHFARGFGLTDQGRHSEAEKSYREALRLKPDLAVAHSNLGMALYAQGRFPEAEASFREAIRLKHDLPVAHNNLGLALVERRRDKEAETSFRAAIRTKPDFPLGHYNLGNALLHQRRFREAEASYREAIRLKHDFPEAHANLGIVLKDRGRLQEAEASYRQAIRLKPNYPEAHNNLGIVLKIQGRLQEAEASYRESIRLQPDHPKAHYNLGLALYAQRRYKQAEASFREAIRLKHDHTVAHVNLGIALDRQGRLKEAEAAYRQAIRLKHDDPQAHYNLGLLLKDQGRWQEAEASYRAAIRLKHDFPEAHSELGIALGSQGGLQEAEASFRAAIRIKPNHPAAHYNLGLALYAQRRHKQAEASFREAIRIEPNHPETHTNLGMVLQDQGRWQEAAASFRAAIHLKPNDPAAHYNLGRALHAQRRYKQAEAAYRQAIRIKHDFPEAHCNLGQALRLQGRFTDALAALRRGHELGTKTAGWRYPSAQWVRDCERLLELDRKLSAIQTGAAQPGHAAEQVELASLCRHYKRLYAAAARFYLEAFAADPKLAGDRRHHHRYNAACAAALAAAGKGKDVAGLSDEQRAGLRRSALTWLRADLAAWVQVVEKGPPQARPVVQRTLRHWQTDRDLGGLREEAALAGLPEAERQACRKLWADVAALLQRVQPKE
jgi:serine/threonine-protein kinase